MIGKLAHRRERAGGTSAIIRLRARLGKSWPAALAALGAFAVAAQLLLVAYHQGALSQERALQARNSADIHASKAALAQLQSESQAHLDALSSQLAVMQARLARLDALGGRLVEVSKLPEGGGEFDFSTNPGLGGRAAPMPEEATELSALLASMTALQGQIEDRELQLRILKDVLADRSLADEAFPDSTPVRSGWISSRYGWRKDPFHGRRAFHHGVDFVARYKAKIYAAAAGLVEFSGRKSGYGLMVEINHGNGYRSRYAHAHSLLVKKGEMVSRGQAIARIGSTGHSTGPHLHFEVLENGKPVNPMRFLARR